MCGIAGVVGLDQRDGGALVHAMCGAIIHRGPDDDGYFDEGGTHLGMRRLAIIDVAHGAQPMFNETGDVVTVFNGEIYNYEEIRKRLEGLGHRFATHSDTESIVHLYEEDGSALVDSLQGMFGLAVWDRSREQLLLARDRLGKKPLFYYEHDGALWFGSELKCLLAVPGIPRELDPIALDLYLTYQYVPAPWTIFKGIKKLPPAHRLIWRNGVSTVERYWELEYPDAGARAPAPVDELAEELREQILHATKIRMISERPLGAFLSGGLDSSAVVAAMARQSATPVKTFSIGFDDEDHNELPFARQVAKLYGTEHHELIVKPDIHGIIPVIAAAFDEPFADSSAIPSYYVAKMAHENVVVALNGDGGDESLGGYHRYARFAKTPQRTFSPATAKAIRNVGRGLGKLGRQSRTAQRAARVLSVVGDGSPANRYGRMVSYFTPEQRDLLYNAEFKAHLGAWDSYSVVAKVWDRNAHADLLNRLLATDIDTYLPGDLLTKVDITTMMVSLEARSPFLDHKFMEWTASLPGDLKLHDGTTKYLLKEALGPWLPQDLIHRKKMGFGIPRDRWLAGPLQSMSRELLLASDSLAAQLFDRSAIENMLHTHEGSGSEGSRIWALMILELWNQRVGSGTLS